MSASALPPVLVAEDNRDDLCLLQHYLEIGGVQNALINVIDGEELVEFLRPYAEPGAAPPNPRPCVLFLDLNMPRMNGFEALEWIRSQPALMDLPVVALAGAIEPIDIRRAAHLGVMRFLTKYPRPEVLAAIVRGLSRAQ